MSDNADVTAQRPTRVSQASGLRTARPVVDSALQEQLAQKAEIAAKAAAEAKRNAELRASLTADKPCKSGFLARLFGR